MKFNTKLDAVYFWYFVVHIPVTIIMDSTLVIPKQYQLAIQEQLLNFHIAANKDFLLQQLPLWLKVFGVFELFAQLPTFIVAAVQLAKGNVKIYPVIMVYGFNAFLTTLVCLIYAYVEGPANGLSDAEVFKLIGIYLQYLLVPLVMLIDGFFRVQNLIDAAVIKDIKKKRE